MSARALIAVLLPVLACGASAQDAPRLDLAQPRHVRALYLDLLGRTPDADETELAAGSQPAVLVSHLSGTREFWEHWYEDELYFFLLVDAARPADAPAGDDVPARLASGRLTLPDAVRELVTGQAFNRANPGNDTFTSVVLEQLLGVNVQQQTALLAAGRRMYDGTRVTLFGEEGSSQADLVAIATRQPAFLERLAARQYRRLVGREASAAVLAAGARVLREKPAEFPALAREWLLSGPYAARMGTLRPKTDVQFVRGLFTDLVGRRPSADELQRLRGALSVMADAAPLRAVIARALISEHSATLPSRAEIQPAAFVGQTFRHYLGRDPSPAERADFEKVLAEPDCAPATVVQAVVTHWEYQYY